MQAQKATQDQVDAAYRRAGELLYRGTPVQGVKHILMRRGFSEPAAMAIIADANSMLGLEHEPGRRLVRKAWQALILTLVLAAIGLIALAIGSATGFRPGGGVAPKVTDASLLILLGVILLIGAAGANLFTLVTACRARIKIRQPTMSVVIVLALLGLAATAYGVYELIQLPHG